MDAKRFSLIVALLAGCTSEDEKRAQAEQAAALARTQAELAALKAKETAAEEARKAQEAARQEARARREQAKQDLLADPSAFIEASGTQFFNKGIFNSYRELVKVSLMNKSRFPVRDIKGTVEWLNDSGDQIASVAFSVPGSIAAGDTKTFSKESGTLTSATIQTNAQKYRIRVTHVALLQ